MLQYFQKSIKYLESIHNEVRETDNRPFSIWLLEFPQLGIAWNRYESRWNIGSFHGSAQIRNKHAWDARGGLSRCCYAEDVVYSADLGSM